MNKEDIKDIALISNIGINDNDIDFYVDYFNEKLDFLKQIEDLENKSDELLFNTSSATLELREDVVEESNKDVLSNAKRVSNNFIEVPVVINND